MNTLFHVALPRDVLVVLAAHAAKVCDPASARPILSHAQLTGEGNTLVVAGTNLGASYVGRRAAEVLVPGSVCLKARWLHEFTACLPDGVVEVVGTAKAGRIPTEVTLSTRGRPRQFRLSVIPGEDYPKIEHAAGASIALDGAQTSTLLRTVKHAVDTGHRFRAVYVRIEGRTLRATAASDARMSWAAAREAAREACAAGRDVQIPQAMLSTLVSLEGAVTLTSDERRITFDVGEDRWSSQVSPDAPPPVNRVRKAIAEARAFVSVRRVDLIEALHAAAVAADGERVIFDTLPQEGAIRLSASSLGVEIGKRKTGKKTKNAQSGLWEEEEEKVFTNDACTDELSATFEGDRPPERFALHRTFAAQALSALGCERVTIRLGDLTTPATICDPSDDEAAEVLALMGVA